MVQIHPPKPFNSSIPNLIAALLLQRCSSLLNSCTSLRHLSQIHAQITTSGLHHKNPHITHKISQFCTPNSPRSTARPAEVEPFSCNNAIRACANSNNDSQRGALSVFLEMRRLEIKPNEYTFPFLFKACASFLGLHEGRQVHGSVVKHGLHHNVYVENTMIHFYGSCMKILDAYKVFDEMPRRTVVSWNSMILACVDCSWFYDSVELFVGMRDSGFEPDATSMVIMLSACSELGNLSLGKWVHSLVVGKGMVVDCQLGTALVDMYGKCGDVNYAKFVFDRLVDRNVWTWSAMIHGFAQHGFAKCALELFNEMRNSFIKPNHVTFLGVLCACSHAGLVEEGRYYLKEMEQVQGIKPTMSHFGAMVDILGRAGRLEEAYDFVMKMPIEADGVVWRALLSACNIHDVNDYLGVGEKVRQRLFELEPKRTGNLVMVANNYAEVGMWKQAAHLRNRMRNRGLKKIAGESSLEIGGSIFRFFSGDYSCVPCDDVFLLLSVLNLHAKMIRFE